MTTGERFAARKCSDDDRLNISKAPLTAANSSSGPRPSDADSGLLVRADPERLKQVLINLLLDAIKDNVRGAAVAVEVLVTTPGRVRIAICDLRHRSRAHADTLGRVFVPFGRLGVESSSIEGTGSGLPLSVALVKAVNGATDVAGTVAKGSRF